MLKKRFSTLFSILLLLSIFLFPANAANTDDSPCDPGDLTWGLIFDYMPDVYILCEDLNNNLYERYVDTLPY